MISPKKVSMQSRGFTLIEALLAIIVVALAIVAMLAVVPYGFNSVQMNALDVQAVSVGQQYLEDERNAKLHGLAMPTATTAPIDPGQSFVGDGVSGYGNFSVTPDGCTTVQNAGSNASEYSCAVTVTWLQNSASRTVTVQSYVTK